MPQCKATTVANGTTYFCTRQATSGDTCNGTHAFSGRDGLQKLHLPFKVSSEEEPGNDVVTAIRDVGEALEDLEPELQERVLRAAAALFGIDLC